MLTSFLASAFTEMNAITKGVSLGIYAKGKEKKGVNDAKKMTTFNVTIEAATTRIAVKSKATMLIVEIVRRALVNWGYTLVRQC